MGTERCGTLLEEGSYSFEPHLFTFPCFMGVVVCIEAKKTLFLPKQYLPSSVDLDFDPISPGQEVEALFAVNLQIRHSPKNTARFWFSTL